MPVVSISNNQRRPLPQANWCGTVYHGLPIDLYRAGTGRGGYLAFVGRISPEKGLDRAIEIAKRAGMKLKIAAKLSKVDTDYFNANIKGLLDHPLIEYIGEIGEEDKQDFIGNARALLFPINWEEPFGLVMIESMACGTPVLAWRNGSVPEVINENKSGFMVTSLNEAVERLNAIDTIDRAGCRAVFEERFSSNRMALDYVELYSRLVAETSEGLLEAANDEMTGALNGRHYSGSRPVLRTRDLVAR
jgi:glycosyltransferase involved in cell wall biosynthesis